MNVKDRDGYTPLRSACVFQRGVDVVAALLDAGANLNIVNAKGDTALTLALTRLKDTRIAHSLVEYGADPGFVGAGGETAFMIMARRHRDEVLAMSMGMLKYNPDTKQQKEVDDADMPLEFVNAQDANGDTAIIKIVRDNKSQVAAKMFPLWMMLAAGCDKNIANNEGKNAVYYAMEKFTKGKAIDGETMLMTFARTFNRSHTRSTDELYEMIDGDEPITPGVSGFMVNAQDTNGDTALIKAVRDNPCKTEAKYTAIRTILALGADLNIRNNDGKRAIDYAAKQDIIDILKQGGTK